MSTSFGQPTTKAQLTTILAQIDSYYRLKRAAFDELTFTELNLTTVTFTPLTDAELTLKATNLLSYKQQLAKAEKQEEYENKILSLSTERTKLALSAAERIASVNNRYDEAVTEANEAAVKKGILRSDITISQVAELEEKRSSEISKIEADLAAAQAVIDGQITVLNSKLSGIDDEFSARNALEITAKTLELKEEQEKRSLEALKYNNQITETTVKNANNLLQVQARLRLQYNEIKQTPITKDELIVMGYYKDMMDTMLYYYNSIDPNDAYEDCRSDNNIKIYLGDYYNSFLTAIRARAIDT